MTRRVIPVKIVNQIDWKAFSEGNLDCWCANSRDDIWYNPILAATYHPGEVVAVAQSYKDVMEARGESGVSRLVAKAGYKNKMFVKADLMPHQIRITKVRVERLQDISDEDCLKEGVFLGQFHTYSYVGRPRCPFNTPRDAFASLIDKVSGKGTWASNPWVFVYEFELVK